MARMQHWSPLQGTASEEEEVQCTLDHMQVQMHYVVQGWGPEFGAQISPLVGTNASKNLRWLGEPLSFSPGRGTG